MLFSSVRFASIIFLAAPLVFGVNTSNAETLRLGGVDAAHELLNQLGAVYAADHPGMTIEIVTDLGPTGGITALADGVIDLAVSSRPLKQTQFEKGLREVFAARTLENPKAGQYPFFKAVRFIAPASPSAAAGEFSAFLRSERAAGLFHDSGLLPVE